MRAVSNSTRNQQNALQDPENEEVIVNEENDGAILETARDALETKWAAIQAGYWQDPYTSLVARTILSQESSSPLPGLRPRPRRQVQPLIKRGTYARVCCMDRVLSTFWQHVAASMSRRSSSDHDDTNNPRIPCQVVVLGAGYDTSYFRHLFPSSEPGASDPPSVPLSSLFVKWYEVDHTILLCHEKASLLEQLCNSSSGDADNYDTANPNSVLFAGHDVVRVSDPVVRIVPRGPSFTNSGSSCTLLGHDLRQPGLLSKLQDQDFDVTVPTLFLSECVQMYLPIAQSHALVTSLATACPQAWLASYEPILNGPSLGHQTQRQQQPSAFGAVMAQNLRRVGLAAPDSGLMQRTTLEAHLAALTAAGWTDGAAACDLWTAYSHPHSHWVSSVQRTWANRCECLDEWEEFTLIMQHYAMIVASTNRSSDTMVNMAEPILAPNNSSNKNLTSSSSSSSQTTILGFPIAASQFHQKEDSSLSV